MAVVDWTSASGFIHVIRRKKVSLRAERTHLINKQSIAVIWMPGLIGADDDDANGNEFDINEDVQWQLQLQSSSSLSIIYMYKYIVDTRDGRELRGRLIGGEDRVGRCSMHQHHMRILSTMRLFMLMSIIICVRFLGFLSPSNRNE